MRKMMAAFLINLLVVLMTVVLANANSDKVLLKDVQALTLHHGKNTNARRSSPVPQLKCVGGTANCAFKPKTVQCQNRGFDGYDVQWECKTDLDNSYRFGDLVVSCEGYNYPDDPYILRGSCGLEYTLDLTEEGYERKNAGGYNHHDGYHSDQHSGYHHGDDYHYRSNYHHSYGHKTWSVFWDLVKLATVAFVIYSVYKCCIAGPPAQGDDPPPSYEDASRRQTPHSGQSPPPYGFRQDYMPNTGSGGSCSGTYTDSSSTSTGSTNTGGGFWSGAFTGGILGYLLGNRGNNGYYTHHRPHTGWWGGRSRWGTGWGNGWGTGWGNGWGNNWGSARTYTTSRSSGFSSAPRSSGTRTASGFGGTTRR